MGENALQQRLGAEEVVLIEEHVRRLLRVMGFEHISVRCLQDEEDVLRVDVDAGEDGRQLIGVHGVCLAAFQHIVRCLLREHLFQDMHIRVDVNGYRERRERSLMNLAEEVARKAERTGKVVAMQPMDASDRRTIHTALSRHRGIQTESMGDEPRRRVVVRPIFL